MVRLTLLGPREPGESRRPQLPHVKNPQTIDLGEGFFGSQYSILPDLRVAAVDSLQNGFVIPWL